MSNVRFLTMRRIAVLLGLCVLPLSSWAEFTGYDFTLNGLGSSLGPYGYNYPNNQHSIRFTAQRTGNVTKATFYINGASGTVCLSGMIQTDSAGNPSGTILGSGRITLVNPTQNTYQLTLDSPAGIISGT